MRFLAHILAQGSGTGTPRFPKGSEHTRDYTRDSQHNKQTPRNTGSRRRVNSDTAAAHALHPGVGVTHPADPAHTRTQAHHPQLTSRGAPQSHGTKARPPHPTPQRRHELFLHRAPTTVARVILKLLDFPLPSGSAQLVSGLKEGHKLPCRTLHGGPRREFHIVHARARHRRYVRNEARLSHNAGRSGRRGLRRPAGPPSGARLPGEPVLQLRHCPGNSRGAPRFCYITRGYPNKKAQTPDVSATNRAVACSSGSSFWSEHTSTVNGRRRFRGKLCRRRTPRTLLRPPPNVAKSAAQGPFAVPDAAVQAMS